MIDILYYIIGWILCGVIISAMYRWFKWLNWKRLGPYIFAAFMGPLMLIAILIIERNEF
jgi:hypothetical protein